MKKTVVLLGIKQNAHEIIKSLNYDVILINDENVQGVDEFVYVSQSDAKQANYPLTLIYDLLAKVSIFGIIVCLEDFVELGAILREKCGKTTWGPSIQQSMTLRDKVLMKSFAIENSIATTKFIKLNHDSTYIELLNVLKSPFLIKPRKGWLAQGIYRINNSKDWDLFKKLNEAVIDSYFAEEFLDSITEYCCDTLLADSQVIAQFPGEYSVSCLESNVTHGGLGVSFPGFLPQSKIDQLKELTVRFIDSLGVSDGFFHTEFLWDGKGWRFGEIGCRLPGGYQLPTESKIVDTPLLEYYVKMFLSELRPPHFEAIPQVRPYMGYYLYPKKEGRVESIELSDHLKEAWVHEFKCYVEVGQELEHEDSSVTMAAHILYEASSIEDLKAKAKLVPNLVKIEYKTI